MENMHNGKTCHHCGFCGCFHHKAVPLAVFLIALVFLLKALDVVTAGFADIAWPILLGLAAILKMTAGGCKCYESKK